jgi:hypothetical protein
MQDGALLVRGIAVGICGTDREIAEGAYGTPSGEARLVIGHESLGEVLEAPAGSGFAPGDHALARQPHAGKVFAIDGLGVCGLPCLPYRGRAPRPLERWGQVACGPLRRGSWPSRGRSPRR